MTRKLTYFCAIPLLISASFAAVAAPPSQATVRHRQLVSCMSKRMASSQTLSYNDAAKACTAQIKAGEVVSLATNTAAKPTSLR